MIGRLAWVALVFSCVTGCADERPAAKHVAATPLEAEAPALQGLQALQRVRLQIKAPEKWPFGQPVTAEVRSALQERGATMMREQLPELRLDGDDKDWVLEFDLIPQIEPLPNAVAKPPDLWFECRARLFKSRVVDRREVIALAYEGQLGRSGFLDRFSDPAPEKFSEALDEAIPRFVEDWRAANSRTP